MSPYMIGLIVALCVMGAASILYGVFRKFTQMSWVAWQILLIFAITLLIGILPEQADSTFRFWAALVLIVGGTALVLGLGGIVRFAMHKKVHPAHPAWRFVDRILGGVTALLDYAVFLLVLAAAALAFFYYVMPLSMLDFVFNMSIWQEFLAAHVWDFVIVTVFVFTIRCGWRVGLARTVVMFIMLALTAASFAFAAWLTFKVPPFTLMASGIGNIFAISDPVISYLVGAGISIFVLFLFPFALVWVLGYFMVKLIRMIRFTYFWGTIDGIIGALIAFAIAAAVLFGLYYLSAWLNYGGLTSFLSEIAEGVDQENLQSVLEVVGEIAAAVEEWGGKVMQMFTASPISGALFYGNPILLALIR